MLKNSVDTQIKDLLDPIVKIAELLRVQIDYVDGKIKGEELVKIVNQHLIREINKGDVTIPPSIHTALKQLNHLDYDLTLIFNSINELDEKSRHVLYLYHFKKMTEREVAACLGISNGSVNNFKKRATNKLEEKMSFEEWCVLNKIYKL